MKKQDIRNAYTQKVTELLNQGYTIFPDTMNGSQGEIAHIDLTNGSEIIRVLLERGLCWSHISDGFHGDVITLTIGRAAADTWVGDRWDGTIWNSRLEPSFQIKWAEVNGRGKGWYIELDESPALAPETAEDENLQAGGHRKDGTGLERGWQAPLRNHRDGQAVHHPLTHTATAPAVPVEGS